MKQPGRSEVETFKDELGKYRSIVGGNKDRLEIEPMLAKQINFWFESARFLITELNIWDELGDSRKYDETAIKVRKVLDRVNQLVVQLI